VRRILAFLRRDALSAASYRTAMVLSLASPITIVIPLYFIAGALQPVVAESIGGEGDQYFAFVVAGIATYQFVLAGVAAVPNAVGSGIRTGTLEALLGTPTPLPTLIGGMMAYPFVWALVKALVVIIAGWLLGANFAIGRAVPALLIWCAIALSYLPFGILGAALLLVVRTTGPLPMAVMTASMFLGGVYYSTQVIPSWIQYLSAVVPLTYGLRAFRRTLIEQSPLSEIALDLGILALLTLVLFGLSALALGWALRYARRMGTVAQY
jgi:ABC-2 type transport system permease protein